MSGWLVTNMVILDLLINKHPFPLTIILDFLISRSTMWEFTVFEHMKFIIKVFLD